MYALSRFMQSPFKQRAPVCVRLQGDLRCALGKHGVCFCCLAARGQGREGMLVIFSAYPGDQRQLLLLAWDNATFFMAWPVSEL